MHFLSRFGCHLPPKNVPWSTSVYSNSAEWLIVSMLLLSTPETGFPESLALRSKKSFPTCGPTTETRLVWQQKCAAKTSPSHGQLNCSQSISYGKIFALVARFIVFNGWWLIILFECWFAKPMNFGEFKMRWSKSLAKAILLPFVHKKKGRAQKVQVQKLLHAIAKKNEAEMLNTVVQVLRQETGPVVFWNQEVAIWNASLLDFNWGFTGYNAAGLSWIKSEFKKVALSDLRFEVGNLCRILSGSIMRSFNHVCHRFEDSWISGTTQLLS